MTVTLSEKIEDQTQQDGSRHIAFRFVFHTGTEIIKRFLAASNYDATTGLTGMISVVEQQTIDNEDQSILTAVEQGTANPVTVVPIHPETLTAALRQRRWLRKLVRWAMRNRDIKRVRKVLYPVWYEFKYNQSYTPTQIQGILDITPTQYANFNDRLTALHNSLSMIDGDDAFVGEVE